MDERTKTNCHKNHRFGNESNTRLSGNNQSTRVSFLTLTFLASIFFIAFQRGRTQNKPQLGLADLLIQVNG